MIFKAVPSGGCTKLRDIATNVFAKLMSAAIAIPEPMPSQKERDIGIQYVRCMAILRE